MRSSPPPSDGMGSTVPAAPARRTARARGWPGARVRGQHQRGPRRARRSPRSPRPPGPTCSTSTPTRTTTASVLTLVGEEAPRRGRHRGRRRASTSRRHDGRPPPPRGGRRRAVRAARRARRWPTRSRPATPSRAWLADEHGVPCFLYGPERSLPDVRRDAFGDLAPDVGPARAPPDRRRHAASAPGRCSSPTTCGSPGADLGRRPRDRRGDPPARRCGRSACRSATSVQVSMNLVDPLDARARRAPTTSWPSALRAPAASIDARRAGGPGARRGARRDRPRPMGASSTWRPTGRSRRAWRRGAG